MTFFSFDFCSVFFDEKLGKRERLWRLHAFMKRHSLPGRKARAAHRGSLSTGELLWPNPEARTSASSYLGKRPISEKIFYALFSFPNMSIGSIRKLNKQIKELSKIK